VRAVIRPRAQDDILRQFRWYLVEQDAPVAAFRFVDAVEASVRELSRMPKMGAPREFERLRLGEGMAAHHRDPRVDFGIEGGDAVEAGLGEFDRRNLAGAKIFRGLLEGPISGVA